MPDRLDAALTDLRRAAAHVGHLLQPVDEATLARHAQTVGLTVPDAWGRVLRTVGAFPVPALAVRVPGSAGDVDTRVSETAEHQLETDDGRRCTARGLLVVAYLSGVGDCLVMDARADADTVRLHPHGAGEDVALGDVATVVRAFADQLAARPAALEPPTTPADWRDRLTQANAARKAKDWTRQEAALASMVGDDGGWGGPDDPRLRASFATELAQRAAAHGRWRDAARHWRQVADDEAAFGEPVGGQAHTWTHLARALARAGNIDDAVGAATRADHLHVQGGNRAQSRLDAAYWTARDLSAHHALAAVVALQRLALQAAQGLPADAVDTALVRMELGDALVARLRQRVADPFHIARAPDDPAPPSPRPVADSDDVDEAVTCLTAARRVLQQHPSAIRDRLRAEAALATVLALSGATEEALAIADAVLATPDLGQRFGSDRHLQWRWLRAAIRAARGDVAGARADLAAARQATAEGSAARAATDAREAALA
ncbi:MAG: hypothetical protein H6733_16220 [Alphaproteobacteria bacterium]|nr:hypothetical protein [Alphaproteobacteria bacterium]